MPKPRVPRVLSLIVVAAAAGGYLWWAQPWVDKPVPVRIETVAAAPAVEVLAVNGQLLPGEKVVLGAAVVGQVVGVEVTEGDEVAAGQLLIRLDDAIARAAVAQAEATLQSARVDAEAKKRAWDRAQALTDTISTQARENARFAYEAATAQVGQLAAALAQARQQLALYRVKSPIDGTVLEIDAELGQVVGSSSALVTVGDLVSPVVETDVDEVYGVRIKPGQEARIAPIGGQDWMAAQVDFVAPTVDPVTGGRTVRLRFDAPPAEPMPSGLTVSVNIAVARFDSAITVPRGAILGLDGDARVLVASGGTARAVPVRVRSWPSDRLIVTEGLSPGDRLILDPQDIRPGAPVSPVPAG